jgi:hypothetical protein
MSTDERLKYDGYVAAYDAAQRLSAQLAAESVASDRLNEIYALRGRALHQIKELARAGFLLCPDANDEKFEQLWRTAFQVAGAKHEVDL